VADWGPSTGPYERWLTRRLQLAGGIPKEEILTCGRLRGRPQLKRRSLGSMARQA
jgi:hypothetical protein